MRVVAAVVVSLVIGCGGKSSPQPQPQPPVSNKVPDSDPTPRRAGECDGPEYAEKPMWLMMCRYTDEVCVCKDMECITLAGEAFAKKAAELAKESGGRAGEITEAEKRLSERVVKRITECTKKVTDEMMRKAQDGAGDSP